MAITYIFIVIYAMILSSFLNVVAIRIPKGESVVFPPSHCVHCHHRLSVRDLLPIFSYLFLKGKCRYCRVSITPLYLFGEITTTFFLTFTIWKIGFTSELWIAVPLVCLLAIITISDLLYRIIPNKVNFFFFCYFLLMRFFVHPLPTYYYWLGILSGGGVLFLLAILSRGGMGGGDVKLMAVVGIALGWKLTLFALFLASLLGSMIGVFLLVIGVVKRKQPVPFGPFLAIGSFASYLWGNDWINWYIHYIMF
ncbi:MAG TPA: prepilin peptidase [Bacillota bacterium]|nr:prepilin peptidase [Bacillota bacterium]